MKGQKIAGEMLSRYHSGNIPPLLIFHGPDGTGKWSAAEAFVHQNLCDVGTACGSCPSCRKVMRGEHADFIQFPEAKTAIGDEEDPAPFTIRWLLQTRICFTPFDGELRFVLFPRADLILNEAETALLKTLEEPPDHSRFIFIVSDLELLKPTVQSRGIAIPFQRMPDISVSEITGETNPEILELLGGSLHLYPFFQSSLYHEMKEKIQEGFSHPMSLLELEKWLHSQDKKHFSEYFPEKDYSYDEIIDIFGMILLKESSTHPSRNELNEIVFDFKKNLHRDVPGLFPYLTGRLFHNLMAVLFRSKN